MTDIKITQLTSGSIVEAADLIPIVSGSATLPETKRVRAEDLFKNVPGGNITASGSITSGTIVTSGDIYTTPWTDYSALSTIVGWDSFTTKNIFYKRIGKLMFVQFDLRGPSGSATTTFDLPYGGNGTKVIHGLYRARDNSGTNVVATLYINPFGDVVNLLPTIAGGTWTASGTKEAQGEFWFEAL